VIALLFQLAVEMILSRVTPGSSSTIAVLLPTILLNSVDLPTFGLPTIATVGDIGLPLLDIIHHQ